MLLKFYHYIQFDWENNLSFDLTLESSYDESYFNFEVIHRQTQFKEIRQIRAYDVESLYGDIGGYMGLLLGYSVLNFPAMIISCYGSIKNKFSVKRARIFNDPNTSKMATNLVNGHSRKMVATNTIIMDTNSCESGKELPQKLNTSYVNRAIMV